MHWDKNVSVSVGVDTPLHAEPLDHRSFRPGVYPRLFRLTASDVVTTADAAAPSSAPVPSVVPVDQDAVPAEDPDADPEADDAEEGYLPEARISFELSERATLLFKTSRRIIAGQANLKLMDQEQHCSVRFKLAKVYFDKERLEGRSMFVPTADGTCTGAAPVIYTRGSTGRLLTTFDVERLEGPAETFAVGETEVPPHLAALLQSAPAGPPQLHLRGHIHLTANADAEWALDVEALLGQSAPLALATPVGGALRARSVAASSVIGCCVPTAPMDYEAAVVNSRPYDSGQAVTTLSHIVEVFAWRSVVRYVRGQRASLTASGFVSAAAPASIDEELRELFSALREATRADQPWVPSKVQGYGPRHPDLAEIDAPRFTHLRYIEVLQRTERSITTGANRAVPLLEERVWRQAFKPSVTEKARQAAGAAATTVEPTFPCRFREFVVDAGVELNASSETKTMAGFVDALAAVEGLLALSTRHFSPGVVPGARLLSVDGRLRRAMNERLQGFKGRHRANFLQTRLWKQHSRQGLILPPCADFLVSAILPSMTCAIHPARQRGLYRVVAVQIPASNPDAAALMGRWVRCAKYSFGSTHFPPNNLWAAHLLAARADEEEQLLKVTAARCIAPCQPQLRYLVSSALLDGEVPELTAKLGSKSLDSFVPARLDHMQQVAWLWDPTIPGDEDDGQSIRVLLVDTSGHAGDTAFSVEVLPPQDCAGSPEVVACDPAPPVIVGNVNRPLRTFDLEVSGRVTTRSVVSHDNAKFPPFVRQALWQLVADATRDPRNPPTPDRLAECNRVLSTHQSHFCVKRVSVKAWRGRRIRVGATASLAADAPIRLHYRNPLRETESPSVAPIVTARYVSSCVVEAEQKSTELKTVELHCRIDRRDQLDHGGPLLFLHLLAAADAIDPFYLCPPQRFQPPAGVQFYGSRSDLTTLAGPAAEMLCAVVDPVATAALGRASAEPRDGFVRPTAVGDLQRAWAVAAARAVAKTHHRRSVAVRTGFAAWAAGDVQSPSVFAPTTQPHRWASMVLPPQVLALADRTVAGVTSALGPTTLVRTVSLSPAELRAVYESLGCPVPTFITDLGPAGLIRFRYLIEPGAAPELEQVQSRGRVRDHVIFGCDVTPCDLEVGDTWTTVYQRTADADPALVRQSPLGKTAACLLDSTFAAKTVTTIHGSKTMYLRKTGSRSGRVNLEWSLALNTAEVLSEGEAGEVQEAPVAPLHHDAVVDNVAVSIHLARDAELVDTFEALLLHMANAAVASDAATVFDCHRSSVEQEPVPVEEKEDFVRLSTSPLLTLPRSLMALKREIRDFFPVHDAFSPDSMALSMYGLAAAGVFEESDIHPPTLQVRPAGPEHEGQYIVGMPEGHQDIIAQARTFALSHLPRVITDRFVPGGLPPLGPLQRIGFSGTPCGPAVSMLLPGALHVAAALPAAGQPFGAGGARSQFRADVALACPATPDLLRWAEQQVAAPQGNIFDAVLDDREELVVLAVRSLHGVGGYGACDVGFHLPLDTPLASSFGVGIALAPYDAVSWRAAERGVITEAQWQWLHRTASARGETGEDAPLLHRGRFVGFAPSPLRPSLLQVGRTLMRQTFTRLR